MEKNPNLIVALIFYLIFIFGLVTYATYDLTSLALIQNFSLKVTIIDLIWGIFISVSTSVLTFYILKVFL